MSLGFCPEGPTGARTPHPQMLAVTPGTSSLGSMALIKVATHPQCRCTLPRYTPAQPQVRVGGTSIRTENGTRKSLKVLHAHPRTTPHLVMDLKRMEDQCDLRANKGSYIYIYPWLPRSGF
jgi:hypothetical protein